MGSKAIKLMFATAILGVAAMAMPASAQGGRGGGMQRITTALTAAGASADDITKFTPLIQAVQTAQQATQVRTFGGGRGGAGGAPAPTTEVATAAADLQKTIDDAAATPDALKAKLKVLRDAKVKATEDLKKAQKALQDVVTAKEEAVLVEQGILE